MVYNILIEHYLMVGNQLVEPVHGEVITHGESATFKSTFEPFDVEGTPRSVLRTPWGKFSRETWKPQDFNEGDKLIITHTLTRADKPDPADWWKEDDDV